jgi:hypothetical protein
MRGTCTEVPQKRHHLAIERGVVLAELGVSVYGVQNGRPTQREFVEDIGGGGFLLLCFSLNCGISLEVLVLVLVLVMVMVMGE